MREKVKLSDLSVLYICPSKKWGTLERRCLQDTILLRDMGGNPLLYCIKGTHLDFEAESQDIPRVYYSGSEVKDFFDFAYFKDIRSYLKNNSFDILHCYSLKYVWSICFLLMREPLIPLFLTFNRFIFKNYFSFLIKWLLRRVDVLITLSESVSEIALEKLPISSRKIRVFGAGVESTHMKRFDEENKRIIGCFIPRNTDSFINIMSILYAMKPLNLAISDLGIEVKFVLFCENSNFDEEKINLIRNKISELEVEEDAIIRFVDLNKKEVERMDILISVDFDEPFNDLEVRAILSGIPVVAPRTASRQNLVHTYRYMGETYKRGDAREIKDKLLKILINEQVYLSEIETNKEAFKSVHGGDVYIEEFTGHYERLCLSRKRLYLKKRA